MPGMRLIDEVFTDLAPDFALQYRHIRRVVALDPMNRKCHADALNSNVVLLRPREPLLVCGVHDRKSLRSS